MDDKKKPRRFKVPERTLLVGTLPEDPARAATEPPPQPERKPDPMRTRLEAHAPDQKALLEKLGQPAQQTQPSFDSADTAREAVPESTAATVEARADGFAHRQAKMDSAVYDPPPPKRPAAQPQQQQAAAAAAAQPQPARPQQARPQPVQAAPARQQPAPRPRPKQPHGPTPEQVAIARGLASKARKMMDGGNHDEALTLAHKAMGMDRSNAGYAALCGYLVHLSGATASGLIDQCLALFDRAIALDPKHPGAHYHKGLVLLQSGRTGEAMELFERTLDLNPDHLEAARQLRDHDRKPDKPGGGFGRLMKGLKP